MRISRYAAVFLCVLLSVRSAEAYSSKEWKERMAARTAKLWAEGQPLGEGVVLYARSELDVIWVERGLLRLLDRDRNAEEWLIEGLNYYHSGRKEIRAKMKGRDIFVLNYKALKYWKFDPAQLVIGGYEVTADDVLTRREYWDGELAPGEEGNVVVSAPSLKPGGKVEIRYGDALTLFEAPRK